MAPDYSQPVAYYRRLRKVVKLPKGNGRFRRIVKPTPQDKFFLRSLLPKLYEEYEINPISRGVNHGFVPDRNCVTNARAHIGHEYVLVMDIKDFFDAVKTVESAWYSRVCRWKAYMDPRDPVAKPLRDAGGGSYLQGLPTSPICCLLATVEMDKQIYLMTDPAGITFTRYGDDMTFSSDDLSALKLLERTLPLVLQGYGLELNKRKTRYYCQKAGHAIVTGIAVTRTHLRYTRKTRRKIRAGVNNCCVRDGSAGPYVLESTPSLRGLTQWAACREPGDNSYTNRSRFAKVNRMILS